MLMGSRLFRGATTFIVAVHSVVHPCVDEHLQRISHELPLSQCEGGQRENSKNNSINNGSFLSSEFEDTNNHYELVSNVDILDGYTSHFNTPLSPAVDRL